MITPDNEAPVWSREQIQALSQKSSISQFGITSMKSPKPMTPDEKSEQIRNAFIAGKPIDDAILKAVRKAVPPSKTLSRKRKTSKSRPKPAKR